VTLNKKLADSLGENMIVKILPKTLTEAVSFLPAEGSRACVHLNFFISFVFRVYASCRYPTGIIDSKYGKVLVAPGNYVAGYFKGVMDIKSITPNKLRNCVSSYYFGQ